MNSKDLTIYCIFIIFIAVIFSVVITATPTENTQFNVLSGSSLYNGDNVSVQLTTENGTPIANQQVNVTLIDMNGERNTLNMVTDNEGRAEFELNGVTVGTYTLECLFGGSKGYDESNTTTTLEIKEEAKVENTQSSSDSDPHPDWVCEGSTWYSKKISDGHYALYDKASGRLIGTGDMPDRHGYHEEGYVEKYSSTVKYRSNGEYYD